MLYDKLCLNHLKEIFKRNLDHDNAKDIPIIAMTANAFVEDKIAVKKTGMNRHIAKPFDIQAVIRAVSELVGAKNYT